jgi:hypothetical protein
MATEKKEQKPQETREADTERKQDKPQEAHEGSPGYGQPPGDVREKQLPDQKW